MIPRIAELFDLQKTEHADIFEGVQYPWEVLPLIEQYLEYTVSKTRIETDSTHAAYIGDNIWIGKGTIIEPGVVIHGPAIIGKHCHLRTGAYIRGRVIIGDSVTIGNSTELKNCFLFNEVTVPHFNYVGDSILGYKVHLGAGAVLANSKTNASDITITTLEKTYTTGLKKCGSIIGDSAEIGANAVLNPGTIIGRESTIYPLASVRGIIPARTIIKVRQQHEIVIKRI